MLLYHGAPVGILFSIDRLVIRLWGSGNTHRYLRGALFLVGLLVLWRVIQLTWELPVVDWVGSLPSALNAVVIVAVVTALAGLIIRWYRAMALLATYLSVASAIFTGLFIVQVGLLNEAWKGNTAEPPAPSLAVEKQRDPVFLILFDGFGAYPLFGQGASDGTIDETRFPNLAELAADSAVFTNATSNYLTSAISIRSLMTGTFFTDDGTFSEGPLGSGSAGLLGILRDAGYPVEFYSNHFECNEEVFSRCLDGVPASGPNVHRVARDFIVWLLPRRVARFGRDLTVQALPTEVTLRIPFDPLHQYSRSMWDRFVARSTGPNSAGKVYFVHSLLPHQPYEFDREGNRIREVSAAIGFDDFEMMAAAYEDQVMFVDTLIGEFTAELRSAGLYERSTIIITGDHGPRSLGLGHRFSGFDRASDYPDNLSPIIPWIPLILHGPQVAPQVSPVDFQLVDLLPTVLDMVGLPARGDLPGVSVFSSRRPTRDKVFYGIPNKRAPGGKATYLYDQEAERWSKLKP